MSRPTLGGLFRPDTIGRILVKHLQPIGTFNGGGSICVFRDPEAWEWPDLLKSKHRQLAERAGILSSDANDGFTAGECASGASKRESFSVSGSGGASNTTTEGACQ